jgi:hypothetical protein
VQERCCWQAEPSCAQQFSPPNRKSRGLFRINIILCKTSHLPTSSISKFNHLSAQVIDKIRSNHTYGRITMAITLTNIPGIMRSKGWANGARLLEIWFSRPSAIAPRYGQPDTSTIRMDTWALTFQRARQVYDQLIRERIWANPPAQREIASMLRRKGLIGRTLVSFRQA